MNVTPATRPASLPLPELPLDDAEPLEPALLGEPLTPEDPLDEPEPLGDPLDAPLPAEPPASPDCAEDDVPAWPPHSARSSSVGANNQPQSSWVLTTINFTQNPPNSIEERLGPRCVPEWDLLLGCIPRELQS